MTRTRTTQLHDTRVDVKVVLAGLWTAMLFVFAYVDIVGFWRADVINGALAGEVPGVGFAIDQTFLTLCTTYILVPSLMVALSLVAPARANRPPTSSSAWPTRSRSCCRSSASRGLYFVLGSAVEALLLLAIASVTWTWPRHLADSPAVTGQLPAAACRP